MKEDKKKVGFFCSLPMCIIMTYFVLPVGLILIFLRLYKKEKNQQENKKHVYWYYCGNNCICCPITMRTHKSKQ